MWNLCKRNETKRIESIAIQYEYNFININRLYANQILKWQLKYKIYGGGKCVSMIFIRKPLRNCICMKMEA